MALRGLENLTGNDITEIKRLKNTPAGEQLAVEQLHSLINSLLHLQQLSLEGNQA
jgi:hypothetical protein